MKQNLQFISFRKNREWKQQLAAIQPGQKVFIEFGGDENIYNWSNIAKNACGLHLPKVTPEEFRIKYISVIREVRDLGAEPILLGMPPIDTQKYFENISKGRNKEGILEWLGGSRYYISNIYDIYKEQLSRISREEGVKFVQLATEMSKDIHFGDLLENDGVHLNQNGYAAAEKIISKYLETA